VVNRDKSQKLSISVPSVDRISPAAPNHRRTCLPAESCFGLLVSEMLQCLAASIHAAGAIIATQSPRRTDLMRRLRTRAWASHRATKQEPAERVEAEGTVLGPGFQARIDRQYQHRDRD
jgi:hypothetical protein